MWQQDRLNVRGLRLQDEQSNSSRDHTGRGQRIGH